MAGSLCGSLAGNVPYLQKISVRKANHNGTRIIYPPYPGPWPVLTFGHHHYLTSKRNAAKLAKLAIFRPTAREKKKKKNTFISISKPTARAATKHEAGNKKKPDKNADNE